MFQSILLAAAIALTGGSAIQNQTGQALVDAQFANAEQQVLNGARAAVRFNGSLAGETTADHSFNLQAGKSYVAVGYCDENCSDVDFAVYAPDGTNLGSDTEADDNPVVLFQAPVSGQYKATVLMAVCSSNCNYGVRFYEQK